MENEGVVRQSDVNAVVTRVAAKIDSIYIDNLKEIIREEFWKLIEEYEKELRLREERQERFNAMLRGEYDD